MRTQQFIRLERFNRPKQGLVAFARAAAVKPLGKRVVTVTMNLHSLDRNEEPMHPGEGAA